MLEDITAIPLFTLCSCAQDCAICEIGAHIDHHFSLIVTVTTPSPIGTEL